MQEDRIVAHVDMDYFYAQIEERDDNSLKGKPVVVCMTSNRENSLGAVATSNYVARKQGIHSGMPCVQAKSRIKDLVMIPVRKDYYRSVSDSIMSVLEGFSLKMEVVSIDEAYLDITGRTNFDEATEYAERIKEAVLKAENLTCSVGVGDNKLIAKMASGFRKPDGIKVVRSGEKLDFLGPMDVRRLYSVGDKTANALESLGIKTIEQLRGASLDSLKGVLGDSKAEKIVAYSKGVDDSPVNERERTQIGRLMSLKTDSDDPEVIKAEIPQIVESIAGRLMTSSKVFKTVTVVFVLEDLSMKTKSHSLPSHAKSEDIILEEALELVDEFVRTSELKVRRIGVNVSGLEGDKGQKSLGDWF